MVDGGDLHEVQFDKSGPCVFPHDDEGYWNSITTACECDDRKIFYLAGSTGKFYCQCKAHGEVFVAMAVRERRKRRKVHGYDQSVAEEMARVSGSTTHQWHQRREA